MTHSSLPQGTGVLQHRAARANILPVSSLYWEQMASKIVAGKELRERRMKWQERWGLILCDSPVLEQGSTFPAEENAIILGEENAVIPGALHPRALLSSSQPAWRHFSCYFRSSGLKTHRDPFFSCSPGLSQLIPRNEAESRREGEELTEGCTGSIASHCPHIGNRGWECSPTQTSLQIFSV